MMTRSVAAVAALLMTTPALSQSRQPVVLPPIAIPAPTPVLPSPVPQMPPASALANPGPEAPRGAPPPVSGPTSFPQPQPDAPER